MSGRLIGRKKGVKWEKAKGIDAEGASHRKARKL